jgi:hypothetical protein
MLNAQKLHCDKFGPGFVDSFSSLLSSSHEKYDSIGKVVFVPTVVNKAEKVACDGLLLGLDLLVIIVAMLVIFSQIVSC